MRYDDFSITITIIIVLAIAILILKKIKLKVFEQFDSPISGPIIIRKNFFGEKSLDFGIYPQGIAADSQRISETYWYYMAKVALEKIENIKSPQILHVGVGANTTPNIIAKNRPDSIHTIIEIDPVVVEANIKYFQLENIPNHKIIVNDFFKLLEDPEFLKTQYDVIVIDICTGQPPFISYEASSQNNIEKTIKLAKPNALIIYNRWIDKEENQKNTEDLVKLLEQFSKKVERKDIIDYHNFKNSIITATIPEQRTI